jgi:hypothetical protein
LTSVEFVHEPQARPHDRSAIAGCELESSTKGLHALDHTGNSQPVHPIPLIIGSNDAFGIPAPVMDFS